MSIRSLQRHSDRSVGYSSPGLRVSSPLDHSEREADNTATRILTMPTPSSQPAGITTTGSHIQRCPGGCNCTEEIHRQPEEEEEEEVQRRPDQTTPTGTVTTTDIANLGSGQPLPKATRSFFEPRFGTDLSQVRIHANPQAGHLAQQVGAKAFTYHQNIAFAPGHYQPHTTTGKHLLAHELTHTIQQKHGAKPELMRMLACPPSLQEGDPTPRGFKPYYGDSSWFHCGFRGILEDRRPTRDDPQNECFYDEKGVLVDENHQWADCGGSPNSYDSESEMFGHVFRDPGGIWHAGGPAFTASRIHTIVSAIDAGVEVIRTTGQIVGAPVRAFGELLAFGLYRASAVVDPTNWTYRDLPARSRRHLNVAGGLLGSLSLAANADELLRNLTRRLGTMLDAGFRAELAADINEALRRRGYSTRVTGAMLGDTSIVELVEWLNAAGVIEYQRSPEDIAAAELGYDPEENR